MRRERRPARWIFGLAAALALIASLHSSPVRRFIAVRLERAASRVIDGNVSIGSLDYALWRASLELGRVEVASGSLSAHIERASAGWSLGDGLVVEVTRPEIRVKPPTDPNAPGQIPSQPWAPLLSLGRLGIVEGSVKLELDDAVLSLDGVSAQLARNGGDLGGEVTVAGVTVSWPESDFSIGGIGMSVDLTMDAHQLGVNDLRGAMSGASLDGRGKLRGANPLRGAAEASLRLDIAEVPEGLRRPGWRGRIEAMLEGEAARSGRRAQVRLSSADLAWRGIGPFTLDLLGVADDDGLKIERIAAGGYGGTLSGDATIPYDAPGGGVALDLSNLDLLGLTRDLGWPLPLAARLSAQSTLTLLRAPAAVHVAEATASFSHSEGRGLPVVGDVALRLDQNGARIETRGLRVGPGAFSARLDASGSRSAQGSFELNVDELGQLDDLLAQAGVSTRPFGMTGSLALAGEVRVHESDLLARATLSARAAILGGQPVGLSGEMNVSGRLSDPTIEAKIDLRTASGLTLPLEVRFAQQVLDWKTHGKRESPIESRGHFDLEARSFDATFGADRLELRDLGLRSIGGLEVEGLVTASGSLSGTFESPVAAVEVEVEGLSVAGVQWPGMRASIDADGAEARLEVFAGAKVLTARCELAAPYAARAEIDLGALPLDPLLASIPTLAESDATLEASGRAIVETRLADMSSTRIDARVSGVTGAWAGFPFEAAPFRLEATAEALSVEGFRGSTGDAVVEIDGEFPLTEGPAFDATATGRVPLATLALLLPLHDLSGVLDLNLSMTGQLSHPDFIGSAAIVGGTGRWRDVSWTDLDVRVRSDETAVHLDRADVSTLGGRISARGALAMSAGTGPLDVEISAERIDLAQIGGPPAAAGDPRALAFVVSGNARLSAPSRELGSIAGSGSMTEMSLRGGRADLALERDVAWRLESGSLSHTPIRLRGGETQLELELTVKPRPFRWNAGLEARLGGALIEALLPGGFGARVSAATEMKVSVSGDDEGFVLSGDGSIEDARITLRDPPVTLDHLTGRILIVDDTIELNGWEARVGDGRVEASGRIQLGARSLAPTSADVRLLAYDVPLTFSGLRGRVSGELQLAGQRGIFDVAGAVRIARGLFAREIDYASESLGQVEWQLRALAEERSLAGQVRLAITLETVDAIRVDNELADLQADAQVRIGGTLLSPLISGLVSARDGGILRLGRARTRINQGRVELNAYPLEPPAIFFDGQARVGGINIEMRVEGTTENLQTYLEAPGNPDLTQGDLATLMVTGRTAAAASSEGGAIAAEALAASLGDALQKGLGDEVFIDVSVNQSLFEDDRDPNTRFNVGRAISDDVVLVYSAALDGTSRRWIIDYRPRNQFRLRAIAEDDNATTIELSHRLGIELGRRSKVRRVKPPRISAIHFVGEVPLREADRAKAVGVKVGKRYDFWKASSGADALVEKLRRAGYLNAAATLNAREEPEGVLLTYSVTPGEAIEIRWRGDDPGDKLRERAVSAWDADLPGSAQADVLAREARYLLQADGYFLGTVEASESESEGLRVVEMSVRKGPRGEKVTVAFEGNATIPGGDLEALLPKLGSRDFFEWIDDPAESLRRAIRLKHATRGLLNAGVEPPHLAFDTASGELVVTIELDQGDETTIAAIELPEDAREAAESGALKLVLATGSSFHIEEYLDDRSALSRYYRSRGYLDVKVAARLQAGDDGVAISFSTDLGVQSRAGSLRIAKEGRSRDAAVAALMRTAAGEPVRPVDIAESRRRLFETRVFRSVEVRSDSGAGSADEREIVVGLVDKPDLELSYGLRYTTEGSGEVGASPSSQTGDQLQLGGRLEVPNPFGRLHRYTAFGYFGRDRDTFGVGFEAPSFFGKWLRTEMFLYQDEDDLPEVERLASRARTFTFQQTHRIRDDLAAQRWNDKLRLQWSYSFSRIRLSPTAEALESEDTNRGSIATSLIGDTRDSFTDPRRGLFWSATSTGFAKLLGSDVSFVRLYGQLFWYVPIGSRLVWASGYRLGVIPGQQEFLILSDRFRTGGPNSVRGFEHNFLGPMLPDGTALGGQAMAVFNQELRFPIAWKFDGGAFYDAGNVFRLASDFSLGDLRHNLGLGLRLRTPVGPIRLDYAWILDPQPGESKTRWVFSFGHAF